MLIHVKLGPPVGSINYISSYGPQMVDNSIALASTVDSCHDKKAVLYSQPSQVHHGAWTYSLLKPHYHSTVKLASFHFFPTSPFLHMLSVWWWNSGSPIISLQRTFEIQCWSLFPLVWKQVKKMMISFFFFFLLGPINIAYTDKY